MSDQESTNIRDLSFDERRALEAVHEVQQSLTNAFARFEVEFCQMCEAMKQGSETQVHPEVPT